MAPPFGAPPAVMTIETMTSPRKQATLIAPAMTSDSPKKVTLRRLIARMRTRLIVITTAGLISVQYPTRIAEAEHSAAMEIV